MEARIYFGKFKNKQQKYNNQFAIRIKSDVFWQEEENKKKSFYDKLIQNV